MPGQPPPAGVGPPSRRDAFWQAVAAELDPAKSLTRMEDRAKQVVTSVSLVGTLLTGLGLAAGGLLIRSSPARPLAIATVAAALVATVLAITALLLRISPALNPGNLIEVEAWYRRQFRRAYPVVAAGLLLVVAVLLAGAAALLVLITGPDDQPTMTLQITSASPEATLTVHVEFPRLSAGELLRTDVVALAAGRPPMLLGRAISRVGVNKSTTVTLTVPKPAGYQTVSATAIGAGHRCNARLPFPSGPAVGPETATGIPPGTIHCT